MKKYEAKILNSLLDQYERSKSFVGKNTQNQTFKKKIVDLFSGYDDAAQFEMFSEVNEQVSELEKRGFVTTKHAKRGKFDSDVIESVALNVERLEECYIYLGRKTKADKNSQIRELLIQYRDRTPLLANFCSDQMARLDENKKVAHSEDIAKLEQILKVLAEVEKVDEETYIRNFSIRVLGDSKAFEKIKAPVASILCEYGDYPDKNCVFEDLNIIKNPGYVYVKGMGSIKISGQIVDFSKFDGDVGLSSAMLDDIESVEVFSSKVVTVENLTTFHSYSDRDAFVIYLGGYHNSIRRKMICKIYEDNPFIRYYHYGDIDAGGFYILQDLRNKTGIPFIPLNMDVEILKKYKDYTKRLTENDRERLNNLIGGEFDEVIMYMLANDCKLEQEAVEENV